MAKEAGQGIGEAGGLPRGHSGQAFWVLCLLAAMLIVPAALTLSRVEHPGVLSIASDNPTPYGYTWSLLLFIVPVAVLGGWFARRAELHFPRQAFWRTLAVLVPLGFILDLAFGNAFFVFPNHGATLGLGIPAMGGTVPIEEFVFYLTGFMAALMSYIWADEYWMSAYNIPDYREAARGVVRIAALPLSVRVVRRRAHCRCGRLQAALLRFASRLPLVFHLSHAGCPGALGGLLPHRQAIRKLARVQFHFLPHVVHQPALGGDPGLAVRLVGLPPGSHDRPRHRCLVRPAHRGALGLDGGELRYGDRLRGDQDLAGVGNPGPGGVLRRTTIDRRPACGAAPRR